MQVPDRFLAFSDTLTEVLGALLLSVRVEVQAFFLPVVMWVWAGHSPPPPPPPPHCGVYLEWKGDCINIFCLRLPLLSSFDQREQAFVEAFFYLHLFVFLGCQPLQFQVWDMRQKENRGNSPLCPSFCPEVPSQFAAFFPLFRLKNFCFTYNVQSFQLYLLGGIGKTMSAASFQKWKSYYKPFNFQIIFLFISMLHAYQ